MDADVGGQAPRALLAPQGTYRLTHVELGALELFDGILTTFRWTDDA